MKHNFEHTFVILAYKESPHLSECIKSLQNQTTKSNIMISTSTPSLFLDKISSKNNIPIIINKKRKGIAEDWTFAYNNCQTKYVTLAHQDDIYFSNYTEMCLLSAKKNINNLITFTDYYECYNNVLRSKNPNLIIKKILLFPFLIKNSLQSTIFKKIILYFGSPISCPSVMFNKDNIGVFKFNNLFSINLDWDAWMRLSKQKGNFIYVKKRLLAHRIYKDSETSKGIESNKRKIEDIMLFERIWPKPIAKIFSKLYSLSYKSNY
ncbi:MAG: glycosyltransferase family A protein [Spirochaetota bacterium]|nr:glycosyltransferase family A protein [Spirochaetota bacterium]